MPCPVVSWGGIDDFMKYLLTFLLLTMTAYAENVRFEFKGDAIHFRIKDQDYTLKSADFEHVRDWSDTYTREAFGTGEKRGRFFVFQGALNNDRSLVFIYDLTDRKLASVANGAGVIVDDKLGWASLRYDPKFSEPSGSTAVILNGEEVGRVESARLSGLQWADDALHIVIMPQAMKQSLH